MGDLETLVKIYQQETGDEWSDQPDATTGSEEYKLWSRAAQAWDIRFGDWLESEQARGREFPVAIPE